MHNCAYGQQRALYGPGSYRVRDQRRLPSASKSVESAISLRLQRGEPFGQRRANHLMRVAAQSAVVVSDSIRTRFQTGLDGTTWG